MTPIYLYTTVFLRFSSILCLHRNYQLAWNLSIYFGFPLVFLYPASRKNYQLSWNLSIYQGFPIQEFPQSIMDALWGAFWRPLNPGTTDLNLKILSAYFKHWGFRCKTPPSLRDPGMVPCNMASGEAKSNPISIRGWRTNDMGSWLGGVCNSCMGVTLTWVCHCIGVTHGIGPCKT